MPWFYPKLTKQLPRRYDEHAYFNSLWFCTVTRTSLQCLLHDSPSLSHTQESFRVDRVKQAGGGSKCFKDSWGGSPQTPLSLLWLVSDASGSTELRALGRLHLSEFTRQRVTRCEKSASNLRWLRANVPRVCLWGGKQDEDEARTAHSSPTKGLCCLAALKNRPRTPYEACGSAATGLPPPRQSKPISATVSHSLSAGVQQVQMNHATQI